jgi:hypothetical protein
MLRTIPSSSPVELRVSIGDAVARVFVSHHLCLSLSRINRIRVTVLTTPARAIAIEHTKHERA